MSDSTTNPASPVLPWKTKIALSFLSAVTDFTRRNDGTLNRRLTGFLDITKHIPSQPVRGLNITDITVDPSRNLWFRLYTPTDKITKIPSSTTDTAAEGGVTGKLPVFIFFHGGGFAFLSAASIGYDVVCRRFARENSAIVVSVNYRLAPEFKYPCQYDDGFDVLKFIDSRRCKEFPANADLSRCFLGGDSAGANIAHHVTVRASNSTTTFQHLKIIGLIQIQPFYGGEERTESEIRLINAPLVSLPRTDWLWKVFLPDGSDRDHEAANVFGSDKSVEDMTRNPNFPHTLVVIGGFDPLQDWAKRYYEGLKKCGKDVNLIVYPNGVHAFYCFPELPETDLLFKEVKDFIAKKCVK
ncbi:hypothetical protein MKW94_030329 [Papaver nudicaule]|uniref:Alpha/beta hydrolase fold-3 domain-containing protein n=1 Tax=Papaver nudicaule TaxID=74823 RepID=A0AA41RYA2_PAPNU|nr:hypothetical protein [Papaver nudicaule]